MITKTEDFHRKQLSHSVLGVRWPFEISRTKLCTIRVVRSNLRWQLGAFVGICLVLNVIGLSLNTPARMADTPAQMAMDYYCNRREKINLGVELLSHSGAFND